MLTVNNLSINYKNNEVLDGFNLVLNNGEIFALLGDSGSGKSSALRFIAGLDRADSGSVELDGKQLSIDGRHDISPEARDVGMVFQDYALFPHMTVEKNIRFGINDKSIAEQRERVKELLTLICLKGIGNKYPHQLSGGEHQRVALARALAPSPKLLLMDEPFSSLDKHHRDSLIIEVRDILKKSQVTSILVTHSKDEARLLADKIGTIKNKQLMIH